MNIKNTILFDPAVSSLNMGDHIISDSAKKQLNSIIKNDFSIEISTHLPISRSYMNYIKNADKKFVLGSNLLRGKMNRLFRQWDIKLNQIDLVKDSILMGVGWWQYGDNPNFYTKLLYTNILSKKYLHSVRDEYTKKQLNSIGVSNVINTSCMTMWNLTEEHCSDIPVSKKDNVIFTITDYNKDFEKDTILVNTLIKNYKKVYFWVQGTGDFEYFKTLKINHNLVTIIPPSLESLDSILQTDNIEFIGTRLHGGIRSLQHKNRTLIIGIDNRAHEKHKDFNLDVLDRNHIEKLEDLIHSKREMAIKIPTENINTWKSQF